MRSTPTPSPNPLPLPLPRPPSTRGVTAGGPVAVVVDHREVVVEAEPSTTVGALRAAMRSRSVPDLETDVLVDGRAVAATTSLTEAGVRHGTLIASTRAAPADSDRAPVVDLRWVDGLDAGGVDPLAPGSWVVGRAPGCDVVRDDPGLRPHHAVLEVSADGAVRVTDLATGRRWSPVGNRLRVGTSEAEVRPASRTGPGPRIARGVAGWAVPVVRPRRLVAAAPLPAPPAPEARGDAAGAIGAPPLVPAIVSLAGGVVLATVTRQPLVLLLGGLAAIASLGTWSAHRVRRVVRRRRDRRDERAALAAHGEELALWRAADDARMRQRQPDLPSVAERIRHGDPELWAWAMGSTGLEVVAGATPGSAATGGALPVVVTVVPGAAFAVAGPQAAADAVVRALLLRLAADHGPAELRIVVCTEHPSRWRWAGWLPQLGGPLRPAIVGPRGLDALAGPSGGGLRADAGRSGDCVRTVLVVDGPGLLHERSSPARRWLADGAIAIVTAADVVDLPAVCADVLVVDAGSGHLHRADGSTTSVAVVGASATLATELARLLAGRSDPEADTSELSLADAVDLDPLVLPGAGDPTSAAGAVLAGWGERSPSTSLRTPIGVGATGVVEVDLVADGPHALVAGTTGSGKSELLRALVVGLATRYSPSDVSFLLVDYKGGSAFDGCAGLPHVVGVVTDLDEHLAARALRSLDAELRRREEVLRAAGAADLPAYLASSDRKKPEPAMPRLVVVIDEFATLAAELPGFLRAIVAVAQRGRSLGVHLVLATQRPGTAVNDDIRANTNLRIALRVQTPAESTDVVGVPVAAQLDRRRPGRAVVRIGADDPLVVQAAQVSRRPRRSRRGRAPDPSSTGRDRGSARARRS